MVHNKPSMYCLERRIEMKKLVLFVVLALMVSLNIASAQNNVPVYGNWEGEFKGEMASKSISAQIVGESRDTYRVDLYIGGQKYQTQAVQKGRFTLVSDMVDFGRDNGGQFMLTGNISRGRFVGSLDNGRSQSEFVLERVVDRSPTFGRKAPAGAIVLIEGEDASAEQKNKTFYENWNVNPLWVVDGDGAVHKSGGNIFTKKEFGSAEIHVEFMPPYMPDARGQARGNSGVYVMGRYEVQVLDSFTDEPKDNLCGGIYQFGVPKVQACFPPATWQTYDITYKAPGFDSNGNKTSDAVITVVHNGKTVHENLVLNRCTPGGISNKEAPTGPLWFQDHNDLVKFRNVWVKPLD
jgi:hypothetical protein